MKDNERKWCEIFESNKWNRLSVLELHQMTFDKRLYDWLDQHYYSSRNAKEVADDGRQPSLYSGGKKQKRKFLPSKIVSIVSAILNFE